MSKSMKPLYLGVNRYVAAVNPRTGEEQWRTRLPHTGSSVVTLLIHEAFIYAGHAGHVYCLEKRRGEIQWENDLPGMGFYPVMLALDSTGKRRPTPLYVGTSRYVAALNTQAGGEIWRTKLPHTGSAIVSLLPGKAYLFVGHTGYLYALDKRLGTILWENGLKGMGFHTVTTTMEDADGASAVGLAAGTRVEQQRRAAAAGGS